MVPTYMRSPTGGLELGSGSSGGWAGGDEVSFITRFTEDIFGGIPLSLATRVRLYSGTFSFESGAPLTWTVFESDVTTNLKWPNSLPLSIATLVSPLSPVSSSLTKTIATTVLFGDLSSRLTMRLFELYLSSMRGSCKLTDCGRMLPPETINAAAELLLKFCASVDVELIKIIMILSRKVWKSKSDMHVGRRRRHHNQPVVDKRFVG